MTFVPMTLQLGVAFSRFSHESLGMSLARSTESNCMHIHGVEDKACLAAATSVMVTETGRRWVT